MAKKTKVQELGEGLMWSFPHIARNAPEQMEKAFGCCEGCKAFLDGGKTERECVRAGIRTPKKAGYKPFDGKAPYEPGDKAYCASRGKTLVATTLGRKPLTERVGINGAHIDSPHLDLKPNPLYKREEITYSKTHYYGGIHKYQWGTIPLAIHDVVVRKSGETIEVCIGEKESGPIFCVTGLSSHPSAKQDERPLKGELRGEELNIMVSSLSFQGEGIKEPFKSLALSLLNKRYGITEKSFLQAELGLVPAVKTRDVGLDASVVGVYGQSDRVCAYTALTAEIDARKPAHTTITVLTDKEKTDSDGNTRLDPDYVFHYIEDLADQAGVEMRDILRNSLCLSSNIDTAYDPTFPDVYESRNSSYVNKGCVLTKYTGARGESGSNDASAEVMAKVISMMGQEEVYWQAGELGAVDAGGGGTIAKFVVHMNMDTVDLGVPILSVHSPFEFASKLDVYDTYKAFGAFCK